MSAIPGSSIAARRSAKNRTGAGKHLFVSTHRVAVGPLAGNLRCPNNSGSNSSNSNNISSAKHTPFTASLVAPTCDLSLKTQLLESETFPYPATAGVMDCDYNPGASSGEMFYRDGPAMILPNLYLGSMHVVANKDVIQTYGIGYVLNVAKEVDNPFSDCVVPRSPASSPSSSHSSQSTHVATWLPTDSWSRDADSMSLDPSDSSTFSISPASNPSSDSFTSGSSPSTNSTTSTTSTSASGDGNGNDSSANSARKFSPPKYMKLHWGHNHDHLMEDFGPAFEYIESARQSGIPVLVSCQQGISRSASLVVAYVMKFMGLCLSEAYAFVKARSPSICPNVSLIGQLAEYEHILQLQK